VTGGNLQKNQHRYLTTQTAVNGTIDPALNALLHLNKESEVISSTENTKKQDCRLGEPLLFMRDGSTGPGRDLMYKIGKETRRQTGASGRKGVVGKGGATSVKKEGIQQPRFHI